MRSQARWLASGTTVVIAGLLIAALVTGQMTQVAEYARGLSTGPTTWAAQRVGALRAWLTTPRDIAQLRAENERLQQALQRLEAEQVRYAEIELENERLRRLLGFVEEHPDYTVRGANVVGIVLGEDPALPVTRLILNVGKNRGIRAGMPVVTEVGLVGRIVEVHETTSVVLPITAAESAVNAVVQSSRQVGVVRGQGTPVLVMEYLPLDAQVQVGDLVLTSGLGAVFPPKVLIGQVVGVQRHTYDMYQTVEIRPAVNLNQLEEVLVLTDFQPNPEVEAILNSPEGGER